MVVLVTDAIQWHEGMLLLPQHFQQNDVRQTELLQFHISEVSPFHWGVRHYAIDSAMLVSGVLYFQALEAIMPDGLVVSSYANEGELVSIDLTPYEAEMEKNPLMIYIAVPKYKYGAANTTGDTPRFLSREGSSIVDENTGDGKISIPRLAPNVLIFVGQEPPSDFVSFPIFKIANDSNAYVLKDFVAPCLKVQQSSVLGRATENICKRIREKIAFLSDRLLSNSNGLMTADAENVARALSIGLLPFEALLKSNASHPFALYIGLCGLAGEVAGLHPAQIPPLLEPYDHNDLLQTYTRVFDFIISMIDRIQEGYLVVPLTLEDRTFSLKLRDDWLNKQLVMGAKVSPGMSIRELNQWIEQCVIVTDTSVIRAMDNRILGADRKIVESAEEIKLLPAKGVTLFLITINDQFIKKGEDLRIFNVSDSSSKRPCEIVLYVPKSSE
jgi:type VI secretion system protein ImpJ